MCVLGYLPQLVLGQELVPVFLGAVLEMVV